MPIKFVMNDFPLVKWHEAAQKMPKDRGIFRSTDECTWRLSSMREKMTFSYYNLLVCDVSRKIPSAISFLLCCSTVPLISIHVRVAEHGSFKKTVFSRLSGPCWDQEKFVVKTT